MGVWVHVIVGMAVVMSMLVIVVMISMIVVMISMIVSMLVIMVMAMLMYMLFIFQMHIKIICLDAAFLRRSKMQMIAVYSQTCQCIFQYLSVCSQDQEALLRSYHRLFLNYTPDIMFFSLFLHRHSVYLCCNISGSIAVINIYYRNSICAGIDHGRRADRPWKLAPYPTDVGTAITGASARPAITVPRALPFLLPQ